MHQISKQNGLTLIEVLIVLTIFTVLMVCFTASSNSLFRSYQFSSDKLHEIRESRQALEAVFNELRLASAPSIVIKDSNTSISYTAYSLNGSSSDRKIYLDADSYLCQNISGPGSFNVTKRLVSQPIHNFKVTKDDMGNINFNIYSKNFAMSVNVKPLN
ncbi:MAG TPA: type II secretion system protein [Bacillota bacterium]